MEQCIPMLEFFSDGLPLVSPTYAASECLAYAPRMRCPMSYTFLPNMAYFEFLPLQAANEDDNDETSIHQAQLVDLVDVKLGQQPLQIPGWRLCPNDGVSQQGSTIPPIRSQQCGVEHWHRETDKAALHKAVCTAKVRHLEARSSCQLVDYMSYLDISLFWEVRGCKLVEEAIMEPSLEPSIMEACCDTVEECLDAMY
ncbi:hypothetical protein L7F22_001315 [Adiantum nelumboides]|nr:hypothetical protein [Adiantum nelumboides]